MKGAIIGVVVFLLALGGSTGLVVMRHRKAPPDTTAAPADSGSAPAADSARADSAKAASARKDSAGTDSMKTPATDSLRVKGDSASPRPPAIALPRPPVADTVSRSSGVAVKPALDYKRLARILANMKAADQIKLLQHLSDDDVEGLLRQMGARQAADVLGSLPVDRAAALGRRLMEPQADPRGT
jgi:MgtE intracellular N domain